MKIDFFYNKKSNEAFTLIELLIVIGILAIVSTVVVLIINPADLVKRTRDSRRLEELASINKALGIATVQGITSFGTSTTVYVSIPDTSPTCANLGLPSLPAGWTYACQTQANYRKVNGSGWIPIDFTSSNTGSPFSVLPVDPINSISTGNYYTYVTGGSWELTTILESDRYSEKAINDGDAYPGVYSLKTAQSPLTPGIRDKGMVGYWKFDETSGTLYDSSGYGNNGTQSGGVIYGATGKVGNALSFDGIDDYVNLGSSSALDFNNRNFTITAWVNRNALNQNYPSIVGDGVFNFDFGFNKTTAKLEIWCDNARSANSNNAITIGQWTFISVNYNGTSFTFYKNGINDGSSVIAPTTNTAGNTNIGGTSSDSWFNGSIDDVRIYNRALSAAEISAIYNATK